MLAQKDEIIVYDSCAKDSPIVFDKEKVIEVLNLKEKISYLNKPNVWYIVDGKIPVKVEAKTILVCSPKKDYYRNFDKYIGTTIRFMPVWSWNEIETCRNRMFNKLNKSYVKDLFLKWGGIPQFILEKAEDVSQQILIEEAIVKSNARLLDFVGEIDHDEDTIHKLIHIHTNLPGEENEEYTEIHYVKKFILFASEYVATSVIAKLEKNYRRQLRNFVLSSSSESEYSTLQSNIFEQIAHQIL
ncbi:hypothetical protein Glove_564g54 [Diversispora epigaea]|uniref:Uncharacterized protein n=1 Tax=Diversispora epigaea TaxID=1348612 RepID=A0A397GEU8_9GLOM|nr:hypothetical protein Glove_564g54 [Diversispora epigaea]